MLTDLEQTVLGVVWLNQPCTAYRVRKVFLDSLSSHWSGSAGAIYPAVRRLERDGLVRSAARRADGRASRLYRATERGLRQLRAWLRPPLPDAAALMNYDPLRVRLRFLAALPPEERRAMIADARQRLAAHLERIDLQTRADQASGDAFRYLVGRGAQRSVEAQVAWLDEAACVLEQEASRRGDGA